MKQELDPHWKICSSLCPICGGSLYYDTHIEKNATHYCKKCKEFMTIVFNGTPRESRSKEYDDRCKDDKPNTKREARIRAGFTNQPLEEY